MNQLALNSHEEDGWCNFLKLDHQLIITTSREICTIESSFDYFRTPNVVTHFLFCFHHTNICI